MRAREDASGRVAQVRVVRNAVCCLTGETVKGVIVCGNTIDIRTYERGGSVALTANTFSIREEQNIYAPTAGIVMLTGRQR